MDTKEEISFGSQDDALFHQAYEAFESKDAAVPMEDENVEDSLGTKSQDVALYEACEAYEKKVAAAASTEAHSTSLSSHNPGPRSTSKTEKSNPRSFTGIIPHLPNADQNGKTHLNSNSSVPKRLLLGNTYLTVSNLVSQLWCEQQMVYNFWKPKLDLIIETMEQGTVSSLLHVETTPAVAAVVAAASGGNKQHVKRDREVNKYVPVGTKTREDEYAIRLINIIHSLRGLLLRGQPCVREIPIFGMPLAQDILVVGTVDELRFNSRDQLELVEFKTRADISKPIGGAQMQAYKMQTMVYKQMLDDLIQGFVDGQAVLDQLKLDSSRVLNDELLQIVRKLDIGHDRASLRITLGQLMAEVLQQFQFLPYVQALTLEFSSRDDSHSIAKETVEFDSDWLQQRLRYCLAYWKEERETVGVDIEDTWKCRICAFNETCEWRLKMNQIYAQKNNVGYEKIQSK